MKTKDKAEKSLASNIEVPGSAQDHDTYNSKTSGKKKKRKKNVSVDGENVLLQPSSKKLGKNKRDFTHGITHMHKKKKKNTQRSSKSTEDNSSKEGHNGSGILETHNVREGGKSEETEGKAYNSSDLEDDIGFDSDLLDDVDSLEYKGYLKNAEFPVTFLVPPTHTIEAVITRNPKPKEKEEFAKCEIKMKMGKFNPKEDKIIQENWKTFAEQFGFSGPEPFMPPYNGSTQLSRKEKLHFAQYLGRGLPNRYLCSIYKRFCLLFDPVQKQGNIYKRFTEEDDNILKTYMKKGTKSAFSKLAKVFGRSRQALYKRHKYITSVSYFERRPFTFETIQQVIQALCERLEISNLEELREKQISYGTWKLIGEDCKIHYKTLYSRWHFKLYAQLFATKPIYYKDFLRAIAKRLLESRVRHWQDVNWTEIGNDFGVNGLFVWFRMYRIRAFVPQKRWGHVRAYIKFVWKHISKLHPQEAVLQRYKVNENGKLLPIKESEENNVDIDSKEA